MTTFTPAAPPASSSSDLDRRPHARTNPATASATAEGGRDGVSPPTTASSMSAWPRPGSKAAPARPRIPEQLFHAGFAACIHSALILVARRTRTDTTGSSVTAQVGLGKVADRPGYGLRVDLVVSLPTLGPDVARELVDQGRRGLPVLQRHPWQHHGHPSGRRRDGRRIPLRRA
jgi:osmotically inducible protein OsmC